MSAYGQTADGERGLVARSAALPWLTLAIVIALTAIGAMMLYSVAGGQVLPWAERHVVRALAGLAALVVIALVPLRFWLALAYPIYAGALGLLVLVAYMGLEMGGAQRWLDVGLGPFQPSEIMKVAIVLALARYFQWVPLRRVSHPVWVAVPVAIVALPFALIMKQPDLGTGLLLAAIGFGLIFLAGVGWGYFVAAAGGLMAGLPFAWQQLHGYQRERLLVFLDPDRDPLGKGYHIMQSKIAFGAGGVSGQGLLNGTQSQLDFLPEKHTDFIFTMLGEELGIVGTLGVIAAFAALVALLLLSAMRCRAHFARLLAAGAALYIFFHMFVNIGMVTGLLPVVGAPLPFVSYGGTSLLATMVLVGLAANAHVNRRQRIERNDLGALW